MPRLARLNAEGKRDEMIQTYRNATQLVSVVAGSATIVIAFNAELLLFAWTGDQELASQAAPILRLYAIGNGFLAVGAFPYYLQYALGNLRYHLIGNAVMVVVLIPGIIAAATYYGGVGAGWVWLGVNGLYLLAWVGFVHGRLVPGLHLGWLLRDVTKVAALPVLIMYSLSFMPLWENTRSLALVKLGVISMIALACAAIASGQLKTYWNRRFRHA
jgi:O-antigen/teichoic acid export membrane protein